MASATAAPITDERARELEHRQDALAAGWMALHAVHDLVAKALGHELAQRHGIGLSAYNLLRRLAQSPGDGVRLSTLATDVLLSPSRVSRVVERLEALGYLERRICPTDARVLTAALTPAGRRMLADLHRIYVQTLHRELAERLDEGDVEALLRVWSKLH